MVVMETLPMRSGKGLNKIPSVRCRVGQYKEGERVGSPEELAHRIFTTVYMGTVNSGSATKDRARNLAKQIGADHLDVKIDIVIEAMAKLFEMITGKSPRFRVSFWTAVLCYAGSQV